MAIFVERRFEMGDTDVVARFSAPTRATGGEFQCHYELDWPDHEDRGYASGEDGVQAPSHREDLAGFDLDVGRLPADPTERLMQEKACVRERVAVLPRCGGIDERAGARDPAGAEHADLRTHVPDHVVDRVA